MDAETKATIEQPSQLIARKDGVIRQTSDGQSFPWGFIIKTGIREWSIYRYTHCEDHPLEKLPSAYKTLKDARAVINTANKMLQS